MQMPCDVIDVYTDSNWAGCHRVRKSTSGGVAMIGSHCIRSLAEAELYAVVRRGTEGLEMITLRANTGKLSRLQLHLDATAAKGISNAVDYLR